MTLFAKEKLLNFLWGFGVICLIFAYNIYTHNTKKIQASNYTNYAAMFSTVEGIKVEDSVYFSGVKVGNVTGLKLLENGEVLLNFKVKNDIAIPEDSIMFAKSMGLNNKFIGLIMGIDEDFMLEENGIIYNTTPALSINEIIDLVNGAILAK